MRVTGQIDWDTVTKVARAIRGLAADGARELTVHLGDCRDGPNLLAMLGRIRLALTECGGRQELVGVALPEFPPALAAAPIEQVSLVYDAVRHDAQPGKTRRAPRGPSEAIAK